MSAALKIFIIYAREDKGYKDDLLKSLKLLQTQGLIEPWHDSDIKPGDEWDKEIKAHLRAADIILPIISFDFFDSDYIHRVEIVEAFERYDRGEALIIPVIADFCFWWDYPRLKDFQVLPLDGKPIDGWDNKKKAMATIYHGVKEAIEKKLAKDELHSSNEANSGINSLALFRRNQLQSELSSLLQKIGQIENKIKQQNRQLEQIDRIEDETDEDLGFLSMYNRDSIYDNLEVLSSQLGEAKQSAAKIKKELESH